MIEQRLDRIEEMLTTLISMVGNLNRNQQEMKSELQEVKKEQQEMKSELQQVKKEQQEMKSELQEMKNELQEMKNGLQEVKDELQINRNENEKQFSEIQKTLTDILLDQEHTWEKTARNERELAKIRGHLQL